MLSLPFARTSHPSAHPWHSRLAALVALVLPLWPLAATAGDEDLPGRVARLAEPNGEVLLASRDNPDEWQPIGLNYPITTGDNLWVGADGRAEVDYGGGQFRMAGGTNLHVSRLDDASVALFVAQGRVILRVRVLEPSESAVVDAPNAQIAFTRTGLYRIEVSEDRQRTLLIVREGEANVYVGGTIQQVLPGQTAAIDGFEPRYAAVSRSFGQDGFDTWSANRDRKYDRRLATGYVSRQMVGYSDLDEYGSWQTAPEYGAIWYPNAVAADWAPYRFGYWANVGGWGLTWVDSAPWGYAPFHYGRWAYVGGRWGWCPGTFVARPVWAPALVGWVGGPGWSLSASHGAPVHGWVPLGWGEPYRPGWGNCSNRCWERYNRPYAVNVAERPAGPPARYANWNAPGAISAMPDSAFVARRPVHANLVPVPAQVAATAPPTGNAPLVRSGPGRIPGARVGDNAPPPASSFYPTSRPGGVARPGLAPTPPATGSGVPEGSERGAPGKGTPDGLVRQAPSSANPPQNAYAPRSVPPGSPPVTGSAGNAPPQSPGTPDNANVQPPRQTARPMPPLQGTLAPNALAPGANAQTGPTGRPAPVTGSAGGVPPQSPGTPDNANVQPSRQTARPMPPLQGTLAPNALPPNANAQVGTTGRATPTPPNANAQAVPPGRPAPVAQGAAAPPSGPAPQLTRSVPGSPPPVPQTQVRPPPPVPQGSAPVVAPRAVPAPQAGPGHPPAPEGAPPASKEAQRLIRTPPPAPDATPPPK